MTTGTAILTATAAVISMIALIPKLGRTGRPLQIGDRVRLSGGHAEPPPWLQGRRDAGGRVSAFVETDGQQAAEITLDVPLLAGGTTYPFALLRLRYKDARWLHKETVHVELWADAPSRNASARHERVESNADYLVVNEPTTH